MNGIGKPRGSSQKRYSRRHLPARAVAPAAGDEAAQVLRAAEARQREEGQIAGRELGPSPNASTSVGAFSSAASPPSWMSDGTRKDVAAAHAPDGADVAALLEQRRVDVARHEPAVVGVDLAVAGVPADAGVQRAERGGVGLVEERGKHLLGVGLAARRGRCRGRATRRSRRSSARDRRRDPAARGRRRSRRSRRESR